MTYESEAKRQRQLRDLATDPFDLAHLKLIKALARMGREAKDLNSYPNPDYPERLDYLVTQVMDSAHEILDLAHDFKHAALAKHSINT